MSQPIVIVSGLPRSGTSMLMKMLAAGGVPIVTDNIRQPDRDNPRGYYEYEKVKHLQKDSTWVHTMRGKAIKVISFLLYHLPVNLHYKVLFVQRDMQEILVSQKKMLDRLGQQTNSVDERVLAQKFETHLQKVKEWLNAQQNMECFYVNYHAIVKEPLRGAQEIQRFLQVPLRVEEMAAVVDPSLYRSRAKES